MWLLLSHERGLSFTVQLAQTSAVKVSWPCRDVDPSARTADAWQERLAFGGRKPEVHVVLRSFGRSALACYLAERQTSAA